MNRRETAAALFGEGFNCAQSLLAAYGVEMGIDHKIALKIASASRSILCRELLGFDIRSIKEIKPDLAKIIENKCPEFVRDSAEIIEELL